MIMEILQGCRKEKFSCGLIVLAFVGILAVFSPQPALATVPEAFSRGFSDIVAKVQPAVVNVAVIEPASSRGPRRLPQAPLVVRQGLLGLPCHPQDLPEDRRSDRPA